MVVDVDDEEPIQPLDTRALQLAALHDDGCVELAFDALGDADLGRAWEGHQWRRRGILIHHLHVLAERAQRERHRQL